MKVVIDTNVIYAGVYSQDGASHKILQSIPSSKFKMVLSVALLEEYEYVLNKPEIQKIISKGDVETLLDFWCKEATKQDIYFLWRPYLQDVDDDMVLEVAVASGSNYIITSNLKDFTRSVDFGIKAITPKQFLEDIL